VFNTPRGGASCDDEGKVIAQAANNDWVAFVKTGNPGAAGGPAWPKFDLVDEGLMEFGACGVPVLQKHFHADRLDWGEKNLGK
jgi:para-nitrobenzyl esterase